METNKIQITSSEQLIDITKSASAICQANPLKRRFCTPSNSGKNGGSSYFD